MKLFIARLFVVGTSMSSNVHMLIESVLSLGGGSQVSFCTENSILKLVFPTIRKGGKVKDMVSFHEI